LTDFLAGGLAQLRRDDGDIDRITGPRQDEVLSLLSRYADEIELFNRAYGLVKYASRGELIIRHILDSIAPLGIICRLAGNNNPSIADAGSGAGLPGIPLAICRKDAAFTLIERMGRRANFLRNTAAVLSLPNVTVAECGLEQSPGGFDLVVSRALSPAEEGRKAAARLVKKGGCLVFYCGKKSKAREEFEGAELFGVTVPFLEEERCLAVIRP